MKNTYTFSIYSPGGNDTALVEGIVKDNKTKKSINDAIMKNYSNVEQVGFIERDQDTYKLEMAGGEFCGNATRSATWHFLTGLPGSIQIEVTGVDRALAAGVDKNNNTWAEMPIYPNPNKIITTRRYSIVEMKGITHVIVKDQVSGKQSEDWYKSQAKRILDKLNLRKTTEAAGVMFLSKNETISLIPIVWVKNVETLFYETACGSGTTAVGLVEAKVKTKSVDMQIYQPSGSSISITVDYNNSSFTQAIINGPTKIIEEKATIQV